MAANSENFEFIIDSVSYVQLTHSGDGGSLDHYSEKLKGDGYYGRSDGLHTVQFNLSEFVGKLSIQGTLSVNPTDEDWFFANLGTGSMSVDTTGLLSEEHLPQIEYLSETTNSKLYNFTGNYVWVRAVVSNWSAGSINSIKLNH